MHCWYDAHAIAGSSNIGGFTRADLAVGADHAPHPLIADVAQVYMGAGLRVKLFKYHVTRQQDVKVTVGLDAHVTPLQAGAGASSSTDGARKWQPYIKISENNTCVKLQAGRWSFQYLL
jgi:hypothetical protein